MLAVPQILSKLGIVKAGTVWKIRKAVYGLKESPRQRQEERDRVLEGMTWYSDYWKKQHALGSVKDAPKHVAHYKG
eukprot:12661819-Prorocentrum_lima.AAC.1